jgi:hypothetical protein
VGEFLANTIAKDVNDYYSWRFFRVGFFDKHFITASLANIIIRVSFSGFNEIVPLVRVAHYAIVVLVVVSVVRTCGC